MPVSAEEFLGFLRSRRSIRRYRQEPVDGAIIERLLEAATWAPSAHNNQPWRFVVVTVGEKRLALVEAMNARLRADLSGAGEPPEEVEEYAAERRRRLVEPPVLVVVFMVMADMYRQDGPHRHMAVQSVAAAIQNMLLQAHAEGLGACWLCGPIYCPAEVSDALGLPRGWDAQGIVALGWPDGERAGERVPPEEKTLFL